MKKVRIIGDDICSPLAKGSEENFEAVLGGKSALKTHHGTFGVPEDFVASLFDDRNSRISGLSFEESLIAGCVLNACRKANVSPSSEDVSLVFSTVKGDLEHYLGETSARVASFLGNKTSPITFSNACTSGVCALIEGMRQLQSGKSRYCIVVGYEFQSAFIVSGFQSFKALSKIPCRPFDKNRTGLNLGEAVAVMVLEAVDETTCDDWELVRGAIRNDANHISGPSRTGEGSFNCLRHVLEAGVSPEDLAFINVHGTATLYNDEMESIAIDRAGLIDVPVNALKGYYGHTMGSAGILETILSMRAVDRGTVLPTRGFETLGVSRPVNVSNEIRKTSGKAFIKLLSGFGGVNAAVLCARGGSNYLGDDTFEGGLETVSEVSIHTSDGALSDLYRSLGRPYPKFFKMDTLSKLGYIASSMLAGEDADGEPREDRAVVVFSRCGCNAADNNFRRTISDPENYFPSPGLFVYTLPNIVTGEIAIANHYKGETDAFVLTERDDSVIEEIVRRVFSDKTTQSAIVGWADCVNDENYLAEFKLVRRKIIS